MIPDRAKMPDNRQFFVKIRPQGLRYPSISSPCRANFP